MFNFFKTLGAAATIAFMATGATAATITYGATPTEIFKNPLASSISIGTPATGNPAVFENIIGGEGGINPWGNNNAGSFYSSVGKGSSATYTFLTNNTALSFLWGTPDGGNNDLSISLSGVTGTLELTAASLGIASNEGSKFVTISDIGIFNTVTFSSDQRAFEYANLSVTAVPVPAALPLLLAGLGGLGLMGRRRRKTA